MSSSPPQSSRFEVMSDEGGSVTLGWVAEDVFYTRFTGGLSASIGMAYAARLRELLAAVSSLRYFVDAGTLSHYELLARSALTRLILENRRKFSALVMLTWSVRVGLPGEAFAAAVGNPISLLTDASEFEQRLLAAAPLAKQRLDSRMWASNPAFDVVSTSATSAYK